MQAVVNVGTHPVGPGLPVLVIAEAGVNHNGDLDLAHRLVEVAAAAGVDAVKFQSFRAERVVNVAAPKAEYQRQTTAPAESQLQMLRQLELSFDAQRALQAHCRQCGVLFLSTPFDEDSADFLQALDVPAFKISSGEVTNWPFLQHLARKGKPLILSTGMSHLSEVDEAVRIIGAAGGDQLVLLHCVSNYPADPADANLRAVSTLAAAFRVPVGYSDHTLGIEIGLAAVALGACVLEKHFTLDRTLPGPDHRASLEPAELRALVRGVRAVEAALGDGTKAPAPSELGNRAIVRRSLAAAYDIPAGTVLGPAMLRTLRPASGISPSRIECVLGRRTARPLAAGDLIVWSDLE